MLTGIRKEGDSNSLLIDGVPGFEPAFAPSKDREVVLEYMDSGGALCHFNARVLKTTRDPSVIWAKCPEVIHRVQRRRFYRLKALGGTEITFRTSPLKEEKAKVIDYSLAGVAFFTTRPLALKVNDRLEDLSLKIPEKGDQLTVPIPFAVVRRVDSTGQPRSFLYALEFLQMAEDARKNLARHIFEKQRLLLRKIGKNLASSNPF